ncbi:DNA-binding transcriptional regulator, AcrR family [Catalinimonas alkaloidigena]|uniref:DNA-binding transcriptional regulator, AcrR family n=1 Tax=Catalinimonas alkaloidigena TaxID=1075417 RepID=A0A1G9AVU0_9BACT|nr:TetR/AcrR family transcriptional regulator [Catalinimonas alkaloidigena]SDK30685.1 DNA-binding transcriptional regulator, AcrR family [Catalinimonas alkaloidigena]
MQEKIVAHAVEAFNQDGITRTTLRKVAQGLQMSDGHLRYYFKTKEDLLLATYQSLEDAITAQVPRVDEAFTVVRFRERLLSVFRLMYHYRFFFLETPQLLQQYGQVLQKFQRLMEGRRHAFVHLFRGYQQTGVFRPDADEAIFPLLWEQFFVIGDNWVKYVVWRQPSEETLEREISYYAQVCGALFLPYLNNELRPQMQEWVKQGAGRKPTSL